MYSTSHVRLFPGRWLPQFRSLCHLIDVLLSSLILVCTVAYFSLSMLEHFRLSNSETRRNFRFPNNFGLARPPTFVPLFVLPVPFALVRLIPFFLLLTPSDRRRPFGLLVVLLLDSF